MEYYIRIGTYALLNVVNSNGLKSLSDNEKLSTTRSGIAFETV